jgi:hypothetical protein
MGGHPDRLRDERFRDERFRDDRMGAAGSPRGGAGFSDRDRERDRERDRDRRVGGGFGPPGPIPSFRDDRGSGPSGPRTDGSDRSSWAGGDPYAARLMPVSAPSVGRKSGDMVLSKQEKARIPCAFFSKRDGCAKGNNCPFLHSSDPTLHLEAAKKMKEIRRDRDGL